MIIMDKIRTAAIVTGADASEIEWRTKQACRIIVEDPTITAERLTACVNEAAKIHEDRYWAKRVAAAEDDPETIAWRAKRAAKLAGK